MGPTSNEKRIELELKNEDHQKERKGRKKEVINREPDYEQASNSTQQGGKVIFFFKKKGKVERSKQDVELASAVYRKQLGASTLSGHALLQGRMGLPVRRSMRDMICFP